MIFFLSRSKFNPQLKYEVAVKNIILHQNWIDPIRDGLVGCQRNLTYSIIRKKIKLEFDLINKFILRAWFNSTFIPLFNTIYIINNFLSIKLKSLMYVH